MDFSMHSNTNNKDISTSESAIPRNRAMTSKLQLVDSVPSKMVRISVCLAAILDLQLKTTFGVRTFESGIPDNMGIAVGISFLAHRYADIKVFPVWLPSSWIYSRK